MVERVNVNARLPVRGTSGAAGYDLSAAQSAIVPAHGKCLIKTGLAMAIPAGCYGRIAPRSGLAWKKFIDIGVGVIDADYRGEVGAILFNFSDEDFVVNQGDRIAQIIFEKIKTPEIKELISLCRAMAVNCRAMAVHWFFLQFLRPFPPQVSYRLRGRAYSAAHCPIVGP